MQHLYIATNASFEKRGLFKIGVTTGSVVDIAGRATTSDIKYWYTHPCAKQAEQQLRFNFHACMRNIQGSGPFYEEKLENLAKAAAFFLDTDEEFHGTESAGQAAPVFKPKPIKREVVEVDVGEESPKNVRFEQKYEEPPAVSKSFQFPSPGLPTPKKEDKQPDPFSRPRAPSPVSPVSGFTQSSAAWPLSPGPACFTPWPSAPGTASTAVRPPQPRCPQARKTKHRECRIRMELPAYSMLAAPKARPRKNGDGHAGGTAPARLHMQAVPRILLPDTRKVGHSPG